jgi:HD domain
VSEPRPARTAVWVWVFAALLPLSAAAAGIDLWRRGEPLGPVLVAGAIMGVLGLAAVPTRSRMRLSPAVLVPAALPFVAGAGGAAVFSRAAAVAAVLIGVSITWVFRTARNDGRRIVLAECLRRVAASVVYLTVVYELGLGVLAHRPWADGWWEIAMVVAAGSLAFGLEIVMAAVVRMGRPGKDRRYRSFLEVRDLDVYVVLVASGALVGLGFGLLGWMAVAVGGLPYLFAHSAFRRHRTAQQTYGETIRALARIPEAAGHVSEGHADRTAALAGEVGRRLALAPRSVEMVERAAYLHDIGRITLNDPGVERLGFTENDIAEWGAEIAGEASLGELAAIIRRQYEPYRQPGQDREHDLPVESRIVKVCSAYDEYVTDLELTPLAAMERLHEGSVYDYDPEIVATLRRCLDSAGAFAPVTRPAAS